jgi:hypothetical protein
VLLLCFLYCGPFGCLRSTLLNKFIIIVVVVVVVVVAAATALTSLKLLAVTMYQVQYKAHYSVLNIVLTAETKFSFAVKNTDDS